ncbi:lipocalin family protein [Microbulbifer pacificus]|uniref:Outer membrane lipoprotein Blc n=1 Tax=Microbulbifer pacificus TaxID=407164 RepID=A0AAU0MX05_9GAMM|nr:lipocalin family protein [Microbulbifer pacificus]WOX04008.1 lipocalin family protein [Microbulbifer pacificus]
MARISTWCLLAVSLLVSACTGIPEGVQPIDNFEIDRYLGKWYEIARLDHSFERGLSRVTAEYTLRHDGGVKVVNRGFDAQKAKWKESVGRAYFVGAPNVGHLKVSFFGPFYGSYVIFELDKEYRYAMVSGPDRSYLWLLSRTPTVDESVKQRFLERAGELGFATAELILVEQSPITPD